MRKYKTSNQAKLIGTEKIVLQVQEVFECEEVQVASAPEKQFEAAKFGGVDMKMHPKAGEQESELKDFSEKSSRRFEYKTRKVKLQNMKLFLFLDKIFDFIPKQDRKWSFSDSSLAVGIFNTLLFLVGAGLLLSFFQI